MTQTTEAKLRSALADCLVALGHVGVKFSADTGMADAETLAFLVNIERSEAGGIRGVCERAFIKAQKALLETDGSGT